MKKVWELIPFLKIKATKILVHLLEGLPYLRIVAFPAGIKIESGTICPPVHCL